MNEKPSIVPHRALIGTIVERKRPSLTDLPPQLGKAPHFPSGANSKTGFPAVQHRSKSVFTRAHEEAKSRPTRDVAVPKVVKTMPSHPGSRQIMNEGESGSALNGPRVEDQLAWREQMEDENRRRVQNMSEEELEEERREIFQQFGPGIEDMLRKAKDARDRKVQNDAFPNVSYNSDDEVPPPLGPPSEPPPRLPSISTARSALSPRSLPGSGASTPSRRLRFAEVTEKDVHVYESQPPSPKKQPLALLGPLEPGASDVVSLGTYRAPGTYASSSRSSDTQPLADEREPEEGTPEYIRRRFFPSAPRENASLAWMDATQDPRSSLAETSPKDQIRIDLAGKPIPRELWDTLPTHLGLHHHAGASAGYTLDDLFLLSRSTVPAQRVTVLDILGKLVHRMGRGEVPELKGFEDTLRKRIVAAGAEALSSTGSLGARAVQVIWECLVGWGMSDVSLEGVELQTQPIPSAASPSSAPVAPLVSDVFTTLPMQFLLQQITDQLSTASLPHASLLQLLAILHRIAQHTNELATTVLSSPDLISNVLRLFIASPTAGATNSSSTSFAEPEAVQFFATLASASRPNAAKLVEVGVPDALLRFITILPPSSSLSQPLATRFLTQTLAFYATLAWYGLYAHAATIAQTHFRDLREYVFSLDMSTPEGQRMMSAWLSLREAWTICAIDPHRTTPEHEILWSQVVGWGWQDDLLELRPRLSPTNGERPDIQVWITYLGAIAAWLEGSRVNGAKGGEDERQVIMADLAKGFEAGGSLSELVDTAIQAVEMSIRRENPDSTLQRLQTCSIHLPILSSALRVCIAGSPPLAEETNSPTTPSLPLPFPRIDSLVDKCLRSDLWLALSASDTSPGEYALVRCLSTFTFQYLRLAYLVRAIPPDRWLALSFVLLTCLSPGDEDSGRWILEQLVNVVDEQFMTSRGLIVPSVIWERGGLKPLLAFLAQSLQPRAEAEDEEPNRVGPTFLTPLSMQTTTTLRLPSVSRRTFSGLPLQADWPLTPLDHLLRSGSSPVFKRIGVLPKGWDLSETEVTRAVLLLAKLVRELLLREGWSTTAASMTGAQAVFGCMKVFMLEHGQQQDEESGGSEEVFRDAVVAQFMQDIIAPFSLSAAPSTNLTAPYITSPTTETSPPLEVAARPFLGLSTPFFQYYTDFLGLYDSISFSHPLFARLLLPPTSMRYALDYRKLLWGDYAHVLKTLRTPSEEIIAIGGDVREWLWPIEPNAEMVGWYLRALVQFPLMEGFVRWVAVHHLACSIWEDLHELDLPTGGGDQSVASGNWKERAVKLLFAIVEQGSNEVVKEVVTYSQRGPREPSTPLFPLNCYLTNDGQKRRRLEFAKRAGGDAVEARLKGLLS